MKKHTERRPYEAPTAKLICFVPKEDISTYPGWKKQQDDYSWIWTKNKWGLNDAIASVATSFKWVDDGSDNNLELD